MKTSQDRILTTHTGSLPRPPELRTVLVKKDQGEPYDKAELGRLTREAVIAIVRRQAEVGIDIINDGEMSKPGYSTYVADRLSGFAGHEPAKPRLDTRDHPNFMAAYTRMTGDNVARRAVCVGPIARSEEHTSELQSRLHLVCRLLLEKKKQKLRTHSSECRNRDSNPDA